VHENDNPRVFIDKGEKTMTTFSKAIFESLMHKTFTVRTDDRRVVPLHLAGIVSRQMSPRYESFTLHFEPPQGEPPLPDNSYLMETESFGPVPIHISAKHAGVPDPNAYYYESVFNVLIENY
jgi:Domain of unknown function (DUF6916)